MRRHHALPSYASIGSLLGLRSKSSVAALVARLKLAGFVGLDARSAPRARRDGSSSGPGRLSGPCRPAQPDRRRAHRCADDRRLPDRAPFANRSGASQGRLDAGRGHPRWRSRSSSRNAAPRARGDVVVAIVDNQFTLKRLDLDRGRFILRPGEQGLSDHPAPRVHSRSRRDGRAGAQDRRSAGRRSIAGCRTACVRPRPGSRRKSPRVRGRSAPDRSARWRCCRPARACATRSTAPRRRRAARLSVTRAVKT